MAGLRLNLTWRKLARVNAFMWRLDMELVHHSPSECFNVPSFQQALPVDDIIQVKGVVLASKCVCCVSSHRETVNHLLIESEIAQEVWGHFGNKLQKTVQILLDFSTLIRVAARG